MFAFTAALEPTIQRSLSFETWYMVWYFSRRMHPLLEPTKVQTYADLGSPYKYSKVSRSWGSDQASEKTKEENITDFFSATPNEPIHRIEDDEETITAISPQAELLRWHYRLGHHSFKRLQLLALLGVIPRQLAKVKPPKCAGCLYGSMTKRPWRTKARNKAKIHTVTTPGDCVSVDQLESPTPGFIATLKGTPTKRRYKAATIFVDHASRLSYAHLQQRLTSSETVEAKHAFEAYARTFGVRVKHYHADNGRFADNLFMQDVQKNGQTISFCGVNAHFQNGIAEKRIGSNAKTTVTREGTMAGSGRTQSLALRPPYCQSLT